MEAYRDQYATIFNGGKKVVVLAVSNDPDTTLSHWARESSFPFVFGSDPDLRSASAYGVKSAAGRLASRALFVVGPDGRIVYRVTNFNVMSADAYGELGKAVARTAGVTPGSGGETGDRHPQASSATRAVEGAPH